MLAFLPQRSWQNLMPSSLVTTPSGHMSTIGLWTNMVIASEKLQDVTDYTDSPRSFPQASRMSLITQIHDNRNPFKLWANATQQETVTSKPMQHDIILCSLLPGHAMARYFIDFIYSMRQSHLRSCTSTAPVTHWPGALLDSYPTNSSMPM